jgi:CheY-like chemotaxis protein
MIFQSDDLRREVMILDSRDPTHRSPVLVVDDMSPVRDMSVHLLRLDGHRTVAAANGRVAQLRIYAERPSLIITDLNMPEGHGRELLEFCRQQVPDVPVLIVSGDAPSQHPDLVRWASGFLPKPFEGRTLRSAVSRLLERHVSPRSLPFDDEPPRAA